MDKKQRAFIELKIKAKIVGYIIDRWHPDAMEGLDIVKQNEIKSYSYELTKNIRAFSKFRVL